MIVSDTDVLATRKLLNGTVQWYSHKVSAALAQSLREAKTVEEVKYVVEPDLLDSVVYVRPVSVPLNWQCYVLGDGYVYIDKERMDSKALKALSNATSIKELKSVAKFANIKDDLYIVMPYAQPEPPAYPEKRNSALDVQAGGSHYKSRPIQPIEYCHANKLNAEESAIVKYITRWREKGGYQDLQKIKHYVDLLIELTDRYDGGDPTKSKQSTVTQSN